MVKCDRNMLVQWIEKICIIWEFVFLVFVNKGGHSLYPERYSKPTGRELQVYLHLKWRGLYDIQIVLKLTLGSCTKVPWTCARSNPLNVIRKKTAICKKFTVEISCVGEAYVSRKLCFFHWYSDTSGKCGHYRTEEQGASFGSISFASRGFRILTRRFVYSINETFDLFQNRNRWTQLKNLRQGRAGTFRL
jgi:hypothetical protein